MIKIAICGKANSGKNTVSRLLTKEIRSKSGRYHSVSYIAFADPIKEIAKTMFPSIPKKHLYASSKYRSEIIPSAKKNGQPLTVRQLLIDIGTSARDYNESVWLNAFDETYKYESRYNDIIIVPDLRFENEFNFLKSKDFCIIKIHRDNNNTVINHMSETSQDGISDSEFDFVLYNNGSMLDLKCEVSNIINKIK